MSVAVMETTKNKSLKYLVLDPLRNSVLIPQLWQQKFISGLYYTLMTG